MRYPCNSNDHAGIATNDYDLHERYMMPVLNHRINTLSSFALYHAFNEAHAYITLGTCARVMVVVCLCVSVTTLAATYLIYTLKTRCH